LKFIEVEEQMNQKQEELDIAFKSEKESDNISQTDGQTVKTKAKKTAATSTIKSIKKKLEEVKEENDKLKDQLLRKAAEFDNYKKRTEKDFIQLVANANAELITELLPIVDDLERFIRSTQETDNFEGLHKGIELIYKNLMKILENRGVKPIEAVGKEFDPEKHEALMQVDSNEHPSGTVVEEHLKGYVMNDRVLRHSQVIVSK
jgi:molecular chaperone GrpE